MKLLQLAIFHGVYCYVYMLHLYSDASLKEKKKLLTSNNNSNRSYMNSNKISLLSF